MSEGDATILVVEDDASVRESLVDLLASVGLKALAFGSVADFLAASLPDEPSCLVLDVRLPGQSGLDLQAELRRRDIHLPIIFITGHGDIAMSVRAMKAGAVEFLSKPFRDQDLLDAIQLALEQSRKARAEGAVTGELQNRYATLTPRERQIIGFVALGRLNKQIAGDLGVSEITVKVHRAQAMRKMQARTVADLVRMLDRLGVVPEAS